MSISGRIFDIQEFAVNDGPGLRTCVFLKGCPLRCKWCHNPEGLSSEPQLNLLTQRIVGETWTVERLVGHLLKFKDVWTQSGGGVTFSGGEVTMQADFLVEAARQLRAEGIHVCIETSGYCTNGVWARILKHMDLVYFDLKCMDSTLHKRMTGVGNEQIIENARVLVRSGVSFLFRVPLVPGVSDTEANRKATLGFLSSISGVGERTAECKVEFLPFNEMAAAKYSAFGMQYGFGI